MHRNVDMDNSEDLYRNTEREVGILKKVLKSKKLYPFFSKDLEKEYSSHVNSLFIKTNYSFLLIGIVVYSIFGTLDYTLYHDNFEMLIFTRLLIVLFMANCMYFVHQKQFANKRFSIVCFCVCMCSLQIHASSMIMQLPNSFLYLFGSIPVLMFGLILLRYTLKYTVLFITFHMITLSLAVIHVYHQYSHELPTDFVDLLLAPTIFFMMVVMFFGLFFSYSIESLTRRNWLQMRILEYKAAQQRTLLKKMEDLSQTDGLTGIRNRRLFDSKIKEMWNACANEAKPLAMIMLDVDYFKSFNDLYGHIIGDSALQNIALTLASVHPVSKDLTFRYGGEEFCMILPGFAQQEVEDLAEKIRTSVLELEIKHENSEYRFCTVSIGCKSVVPQYAKGAQLEQSVSKFVDETDKALYKAKLECRNAVYVSPAS